MIHPWHVVAIGETIRRAVESGTPIIMLTDPGPGPVAAARRVARLFARNGRDDMAWRAPHESLGDKAMIREVQLASGGMLFLDEIGAFRRSTLALAKGAQVVATACVPRFGHDSQACGMAIWAARMDRIAESLGAQIVDVRMGARA